MALECSLDLSTGLSPVQVLRLLAEQLHFEWGDEQHLLGPGLGIAVVGKTARGCEVIEEAFGFSPDVLVIFRLDFNGDYEEGHRLMMRATQLLLEHGRDGVLLTNGEHIVLQRLGGQLTLNADYGNWTDGLRLESEIRLPYEKRSLPSPLL